MTRHIYKRLLLFASCLIFFFLFAPKTIAAATNMQVPYTSQAPMGNWSQPWQDACEEAVTVMIDNYYRGKKTKSISISESVAQIKQIINLENKIFGFNKDTNAAQIAEIINVFYNWEAYVVSEPSIEQITAEIDNGRPVIALLYGKNLKNPYFRRAGPDYHTIVIKGYNEDRQEFITHEPGMNNGLDYRYSYATIMNALHDFVPSGKTITGAPVAVFTRPGMSDSAYTDGDNDGLIKKDELEYGTSLWKSDSDGDGYSDGTEVKGGYSPILNERRIPDNSLVKSISSPRVYLIEKGVKYEIWNEEVFTTHGWRWQDIKIVSEKFIQNLEEGFMITM